MGWKIQDWEVLEPNARSDRPDQYKDGIRKILLRTTVHTGNYISLVEGPHGAANLGCWAAIAEYWARQKMENRQDGCLWNGGKPASAKDIAIAAHINPGPFRYAIPKLLEIGWLQEWATNDGQMTTNDCQMTDPLKVRLGKVNLGEVNTIAHFETFWKAYPKKKSKGRAKKAFFKINPDEQLLAIMVANIEQAKKSKEWLKDEGQFIPYPEKWLNAQGWEDEFTPAKGLRLEDRLFAQAKRERMATDARGLLTTRVVACLTIQYGKEPSQDEVVAFIQNRAKVQQVTLPTADPEVYLKLAETVDKIQGDSHV